jgi:hypothetical protein
MLTLPAGHLMALRLISLLLAQGLLALGLWLAGEREPWWASGAWWPWSLTLANSVALGWWWRTRRPNPPPLRPAVDPPEPQPTAALRQLPLLLLAAIAPPLLLAHALWPDPNVARWLLTGADPPLHAWVVLLLAPLSSALVELPLLRQLLHRGRGPTPLRVIALALAFSAQHALHPFVPAMSFFLWRSLMSIPLWLFYAISLARRPRLLPHWILTHALLLALAGAWVLGG